MDVVSDIHILLREMSPVLSPEEYVFILLGRDETDMIAALRPLSVFMEEEGVSLIVRRETADQNKLPYESVFRKITLHVYSSLNAVGLTSAVATCLANKGISANVVAAYCHDHIFVPSSKAEEAMIALKNINTQM